MHHIKNKKNRLTNNINQNYLKNLQKSNTITQ